MYASKTVLAKWEDALCDITVTTPRGEQTHKSLWDGNERELFAPLEVIKMKESEDGFRCL